MIRSAILAIAAAAALTVIATPAHAGDWYVKAEVGTTFDSEINGIELSDAPVYGAHVGTAVGPVRVEGGVRHVSGDISLGFIDVETSAINYTATAYLDLATSANSGFFIGAGPDYWQGEASIGPFFNTDVEGFGYHVTGGYATRITDRAVFEVAARYDDADLDGIDLTGVSATAGVRFRL